jgi:AraC-like DNA-binding protein
MSTHAAPSTTTNVDAYVTNDPEQAHEWLRMTYTDHTVRLSGTQGNFVFRSLMTWVDTIQLSEFHHSMAARVEIENERRRVIIFKLTDGRYDVTRGRDILRLGPGDSALLPPREALSIDWSNVAISAVAIDRLELGTIAADLTGRNPADIVFELSRPTSAIAERRWWQTVAYVDKTLRRSTEQIGPLMRSEVKRLITAAALEAFPNTETVAPSPPGPGSGRPWLRRALIFIDDHADQDISLNDIATAARVSPRTLQSGFRRYLNTTPLHRVREVRIDMAHQDLMRGHPQGGDTVAAIAHRWGFHHLGRFSVSYRTRYGRLPRDTLYH